MQYFEQRFINNLNEDGDIEIRGNRWNRYEVLERMDPDAKTELFENWVEQAVALAKERTREFLLRYRSLQRFQRLTDRWRNGNVIPFVGAGMSIPSGHLPWAEFLSNLGDEYPEVRDALNPVIEAHNYEEAAQLLFDELGADVLHEAIANAMGRHRRRTDGPVNLLPELFTNGAVTTNFDYILDFIYDAQNQPFTRTYCGQDIAHVGAQNANHPHCLVRLHGEAEISANRVLTRNEYAAAYGERSILQGFLGQLIGLRSLLFLGCSLHTDRTYSALHSIRQANAVEPVPHYAILPFPGERQVRQRREFLSQAAIHPIYYPPETHDDSIEDLLITLHAGGLDD